MRLRDAAIALLLVLGQQAAHANVPKQFAVQGVLRDNIGKLQSMMVNVTAALYDAQTSGNKLAGPFGPTPVMAVNGLFTLTLPDNNVLSEIGGAAEVWLEVIIGNDIFPRQLVTPEIYSLMCAQADDAKQLGGQPPEVYAPFSTQRTVPGPLGAFKIDAPPPSDFQDAQAGFSDWMVSVPVTGDYLMAFETNALYTVNGGTFVYLQVKVDGAVPTNQGICSGYFSTPNAVGPQLHCTFHLTGLTAGAHTIRMQMRALGQDMQVDSGVTRAYFQQTLWR